MQDIFAIQTYSNDNHKQKSNSCQQTSKIHEHKEIFRNMKYIPNTQTSGPCRKYSAVILDEKKFICNEIRGSNRPSGLYGTVVKYDVQECAIFQGDPYPCILKIKIRGWKARIKAKKRVQSSGNYGN